jgi:hypothetical protein
VTEVLLLCAACVAARPNDQDAAYGSEWASTIYRGNGLCLPHFREVRIKEQDAAIRATQG